MILLGLLIWAGQSVPWLRLGRLPGDIRIERPGFRLYILITTMVVLSLGLTALFWLVSRVKK